MHIEYTLPFSAITAPGPQGILWSGKNFTVDVDDTFSHTISCFAFTTSAEAIGAAHSNSWN